MLHNNHQHCRKVKVKLSQKSSVQVCAAYLVIRMFTPPPPPPSPPTNYIVIIHSNDSMYIKTYTCTCIYYMFWICNILGPFHPCKQNHFFFCSLTQASLFIVLVDLICTIITLSLYFYHF